MFSDLMQQINYLDLVALVLFVRIVYIAGQRGSIIEAFKMVGVIAGIIISFENYDVIGSFVMEKLSLPPELINVVFFVALVFFGYFILVIFRDLVLKVFKKKDKVPGIDRPIAMIFGVVRFSLIYSIMLVAMLISGVTGTRDIVKNSYLAHYFVPIAPKVHSVIFQQIAQLNPDIKSNPGIEKALKIK